MAKKKGKTRASPDWGGIRAGSGRKLTEGEPLITTTVQIATSKLHRIDKLAKKWEHSRSAAIRRLLDLGLRGGR